jgi:hypothetical protein
MKFDAMQFGGWVPMFWRKLLHPSSGSLLYEWKELQNIEEVLYKTI